ncbi:AraC family transcriptional regulator ligand-binding domain-containing protein [bacterium SCSIO 12741]|nr:AraC family transcriptional regulator ligand-binding domain-containing protein [bacterium SCSIO 12741]
MDRVAAPFVASLYEYASLIGVDENRLRSQLNQPDVDLCSPEQFVTSQEYQDTFKFLYEASKDEHFGLHLGTFLNLKALGLIYQLSIQSSSFDQALFLVSEYFSHAFPVVSVQAIQDDP